MKSMHKALRSGFTMIELAIVLVIISLLIGSLLIGQEIIKGAQMRVTISQFEQYDAQAAAFRSKYSGMPGDLANAAAFFTNNLYYPNATANGGGCASGGSVAVTPGNSLLEDCSGTHVKLTGEPAAFWVQLYQADLIPDSISDTNLVNGGTPANIANAFPSAKLGGHNFIFIYSTDANISYPGLGALNVYRIAGLTAVAGGVPTLTNNLTPLLAYQIDMKLDDGVANTGVVQGTDDIAHFNIGGTTLGTSEMASTTYGATTCQASAGIYNVASQGNTPLCQLLVRSNF